MKKYEEEHYLFENIKTQIYPWVKEELTDHQVLNGKHFSVEDIPVIAFIGDLKVIFVIKRGEDSFEVLKDNMLPPDFDVKVLYHTACENLVRDVEFVISHTWYGGFGIIADGIHEASALCFQHIWTMCADKLKDDLVIMVPSKDIVLFTRASEENKIDKMVEYAKEAYDRSNDKISLDMFIFTKEGRELLTYDKQTH